MNEKEIPLLTCFIVKKENYFGKHDFIVVDGEDTEAEAVEINQVHTEYYQVSIPKTGLGGKLEYMKQSLDENFDHVLVLMYYAQLFITGFQEAKSIQHEYQVNSSVQCNLHVDFTNTKFQEIHKYIELVLGDLSILHNFAFISCGFKAVEDMPYDFIFPMAYN